MNHLENQPLELFCNFIKKETRAQVFSCEFSEIFKKSTFFTETFRTIAFLFNHFSSLFRMNSI